jgi:hypothetical protein
VAEAVKPNSKKYPFRNGWSILRSGGCVNRTYTSLGRSLLADQIKPEISRKMAITMRLMMRFRIVAEIPFRWSSGPVRVEQGLCR